MISDEEELFRIVEEVLVEYERGFYQAHDALDVIRGAYIELRGPDALRDTDEVPYCE